MYMKLERIFEATTKANEPPQDQSKLEQLGTFIALKPSIKTLQAIDRFILDQDIPNPLPDDMRHCTLIHSERYLENEYRCSCILDRPLIGVNPEMDILGDGKENKALVIRFESQSVTKRHEDLLREFDLTWDYPEYIPHVSLTYDMADWEGDLALLSYKLSDYLDHLEFVEEYSEPIAPKKEKSKS